ncbi:MAG: hypothetical protein M3R22_08090 [Pseudomonadota bacterium]|nr:hypothetical protein [Pseudomonadota bacterium]
MLNFSVHALPSPDGMPDPKRTRHGRWQMLTILVVCAAPVVASYLAFFGWRPHSLTNYSELILPPRQLPAQLAINRLDGSPVSPEALRGQWLLVVVAGGACDAVCERHLWLQRQLHQTLGGEKDRVDKIWLVDDGALPRSETLRAIGAIENGAPPPNFAGATVLRVDKTALSAWLEPARGRALEDHLYIVDPRGAWMMRVPPDADPAGLKRDIDKLLRASAGWDRPGR